VCCVLRVHGERVCLTGVCGGVLAANHRYTFFITAFVCAVSVVVSLWVWKRRRDAERRKHAHDRYLSPTVDGEDAFPVKTVESW
jgi:phosphoribulokinase